MIHLRTLGTLELRGSDGAELRSVLAQPKRLALLAYLAVASPQGFHRRDTLLGLLWPEMDEEHARSALSQAIYYLRRSLGREVVLSRGNEEVAVDPDRLWCDAAAFRQAMTAGVTQDALELYGGDLLPGFFLSDAIEWERWLEEERARLRGRAAEAAWTLAERAGAEGGVVNAARWGRRALALSSGDEGQLRRLIVLLDGLGDRAGAIGAYEEFAERFAREYEVEPSPETQALVTAVRSRAELVERDPSPAAHASVPHAGPAPELGASLGRLDVGPAEERPAGAGHRPSHRPRRGPWRLFGGAAVGAALLLAALLLWPRVHRDNAPDRRAGAGTPASGRLAVLPLANASPDPDDAYVAGAITDELIARLSGLAGLQVIARSSSASSGGEERSISDVAAELHAASVLEGSVRKAGDRVRITVRLVDGGSEERLWSAHYDQTLADVPAVQRAIVDRVAQALLPPVRVDDRRRAGSRGTEDPEAYEAYLKGRYYLGRLDEGAFAKARDHFQRALDLDPTFPQAWSGLADAYGNLTSVSALHAREAYPRARAAAERALELDPELADAHASLAMALSMYYWDNDVAERHFRRAIALNPSHARARRMYASHLRNLGRFDEALIEARTAQALDPLSAFPRLEEGTILYAARRYDAAIAQSRRLLGTTPSSTHAYMHLALAYAQNERYEEALAALRAGDPDGDQPDAHAIRGYVYAAAGRRDAALRMLDTLDLLAAERPVSAFHRAAIYVGLGEHDRALDVLEQASRERIGLIRLLKVEPIFDPLRSEPRFRALLEKVGLAG